MPPLVLCVFLKNTAPTGIYTLSLHDALPICTQAQLDIATFWALAAGTPTTSGFWIQNPDVVRSEEHTSELQSHSDIVCRLLLEKKNTSSHYSLDYQSPINFQPKLN